MILHVTNCHQASYTMQN